MIVVNKKNEEVDLDNIYTLFVEESMSMKKLAEICHIPGTTLRRMLDRQYGEKEAYQNRIKENERYRKKKQEEIHNKKEIPSKLMYFQYINDQKEGLTDAEIRQKLGIDETTFSLKIKEYETSILEGKVILSSKEFNLLPQKMKIEVLYQKASRRRLNYQVAKIKKKDFEENLKEIETYFCQERNQEVQNTISNEQLYSILYADIDMANTRVNKNIKPKVEKIDQIIGKELANQLLKNNMFILSFSLEKIEEFLCLVIDENYLMKYIKSGTRISTEKLYALIQYAKENKIETNISQIIKVVIDSHEKGKKGKNHDEIKRMAMEKIMAKYPYPKEYKEIGKKIFKQEDKEDQR